MYTLIFVLLVAGLLVAAYFGLPVLAPTLAVARSVWALLSVVCAGLRRLVRSVRGKKK